MTSPVLRFAARVMLGVFMLGFSLSAQAAEFTVDQLMGALANHKHGAATFTEKKYISILDQPVESSGELLFVSPARLEKRTLKPKVETLVLDGDVITVEHRLRKQVLQLKDYPEVAGMIESIRATLAGDRKALERAYHLSLEGSRDRWTLVLTPLDARVGSAIARIRMEGTRDEVRTVEILQADGDRSVMSVQRGAGPVGP
jgi:outer membrane lipoprotein-sorting protein